jgi:hypothetical protein
MLLITCTPNMPFTVEATSHNVAWPFLSDKSSVSCCEVGCTLTGSTSWRGLGRLTTGVEV